VRRLAFLLVAVGLLFTACSSKPKVPDIFKTQLMKFLEEGTKTNAKASQGVSYLELREQMANTKAAYDLMSSTWPPTLAVDCRSDFEKALNGWNLTLYIWELKFKKSDEPTEPNINGYERYVAFAGIDHLVLKVHESDFVVEEYRGKIYLPFDENIPVLLAIAGSSFNEGRDKILKALQ
jgi:hypothetical protein